MEIRFSGKNISVTEGIREHFTEKLLKFDRYVPRIVDAHAIIKKEKYLFEAEVVLLAKKLRAYGEGKSKENIYAAIDEACSKVEKQLKKHRDKVKAHHQGHGRQNVPKVRTAEELNQ